MHNEEKNTQTTLFGDEVKAIEQEVTICVEREYDRTKDEYEQHYGKYVVTMADVEESWTEWVKDPWPWDDMKGDGSSVAV